MTSHSLDAGKSEQIKAEGAKARDTLGSLVYAAKSRPDADKNMLERADRYLAYLEAEAGDDTGIKEVVKMDPAERKAANADLIRLIRESTSDDGKGDLVAARKFLQQPSSM